MATKKRELTDCPDCGVKPGEVHNPICDVQLCSVCGGQYLQCLHRIEINPDDKCEGHNPGFARWTGINPGEAEAEYLGVDLYGAEWHKIDKIFYVEPIVAESPFYEPTDDDINFPPRMN